MLVRMWGTWNSHPLLVLMAALKNSLAMPQKVKHRVTYCMTQQFHFQVYTWDQNMCAQKCIHRCSQQYNSYWSKVKTTQTSFSWWMDKHNVAYPLHNKKKCNADTCYSMDESWKRAKRKKPVTKDHILYDFKYLKCLE